MESVRSLLTQYPAWAIVRTCETIRTKGYDSGEKIERHWPPSDPEIVAAVATQTRLYRDTYDSAQKLLTAEVEKC